METKTWDDFSRVYTAVDITPDTIIVELTCSGFACAPVSFSFWFLIHDIEALPDFHKALAEISASDGEEPGVSDEVSKVQTLREFLADEKNQVELLEAYNTQHDQELPTVFRFTIPGDEEMVAQAINAHNSIQF